VILDFKTQLARAQEKPEGDVMSENRVATVEQSTALAISIFRLGEEQGITLKPMPNHQGAVIEPYCDDKFLYRDIRDMPPDFQIPIEAVRRFSLVYDTGTVRQVVIAEELEPYKEWQRAVDTGKEVGKGLAVGAGVVATAAAVVATGGLLALIAAVPLFLAADPKLIAILSDGTWISCAEWI
jgi:hypothetical protein